MNCFQYEYFVKTAERLAEHPWANECKDFILKYRVEKKVLTQSFEIPPVILKFYFFLHM